MVFGIWFSWLVHWATPGGVTFPNTPENRWVLQGIERAKREGLLVEYPEPSWRPRQPSRYELAVSFHATATNHLELLKKAPYGVDDRTRAMLLRSEEIIQFYRKATLEFAPELITLGVMDEPNIELIGPLSNRLKQWSPRRFLLFRDVPPTHWAVKAVGDLRAVGLIHGYPDGRFKG